MKSVKLKKTQAQIAGELRAKRQRGDVTLPTLGESATAYATSAKGRKAIRKAESKRVVSQFKAGIKERKAAAKAKRKAKKPGSLDLFTSKPKRRAKRRTTLKKKAAPKFKKSTRRRTRKKKEDPIFKNIGL